MAAAKRYRGQKQNNRKKSPLAVFLVWICVIAILVGAGFFVVSVFFKDSGDNLKKSFYPQTYSEYVDAAAQKYNLDPALIYAVIRTESGFDPDARSEAGAYGIMQIMPSSFEWLMNQRGESEKYTADDLFNPEICIDYGSYLLSYFYDYYNDERCAIAAYNAGFVVSDWLENPDYSSDGKTLTNIPYPETSAYVERVEEAKSVYIELYYTPVSLSTQVY